MQRRAVRDGGNNRGRGSRSDGRAERTWPLVVRPVRDEEEDGLWKHFVRLFHYLGSGKLFGHQIKYFAFLGSGAEDGGPGHLDRMNPGGAEGPSLPDRLQ